MTKIEGTTLETPNIHHAVLTQDQHRYTDVPCDAQITPLSVYLTHHGPDLNYRPMLKIIGELRSVSLVEDSLPYGLDEIAFRPGDGQRVEAIYEFTDEQLNDLAGKGYFRKGFAVPEQVSTAEYILPAQGTIVVLPPQDPEDVPVAVVTLENPCGLRINEANSGYDLAEYFENAPVPQAVQEEAALVSEGPVYDDTRINDIIREEDLEDIVYEGSGPSEHSLVAEEEEEKAAETDFDRELAEATAEYQESVSAYETERRERDPNAERYEEVVGHGWIQEAQDDLPDPADQTGLSEGVSDLEDQKEKDSITLLDLSETEEDEEISVAPVPLSISEELKLRESESRAASRRARREQSSRELLNDDQAEKGSEGPERDGLG